MQIWLGHDCGGCARSVFGVVTRGRPDSCCQNQRVTSYRVETTTDAVGLSWTDQGTYTGNVDATPHDSVYNYFPGGPVHGVVYVRIYPLLGTVSLRADVLI